MGVIKKHLEISFGKGFGREGDEGEFINPLPHLQGTLKDSPF